APEPMPSGSASGEASGFSTAPHTGQPSMPEQAGSLQSARPLPSLSRPSVHTSAPPFGASTTVSKSPSLRPSGPQATREKTEAEIRKVFPMRGAPRRGPYPGHGCGDQEKNPVLRSTASMEIG